MWQCPSCKESFIHENQWHSCLKVSLDNHFAQASDGIVLTFDAILQIIETLGPFHIRSVKSAIIFKKKSAFASVKVQKSGILLEWFADRFLEDERIRKTTQISTNRIVHVIKLTHPEEMDDRIRKYLRTAYTSTR